jgi:hypothetical protein
MKRINLIPKQRRDASRMRSRLRGWMYACGVYGGAIVLVFVLLRFWRDDSAMFAGEISRLAQSANDTQQAINTLTPNIQEKQALLEAARAVADQPDWSVLLMLLGKTDHREAAGAERPAATGGDRGAARRRRQGAARESQLRHPPRRRRDVVARCFAVRGAPRAERAV